MRSRSPRPHERSRSFSVSEGSAAHHVRFTREADKLRTSRDVRFVPILLQKSLMVLKTSDSVAVMRFAVEASDDGAAQSRPRTAALFISS